MSDAENDLRATAEDIAADAARLTVIEVEKARMGSRDPRLAELSAESERIAKRLVPKTAAETLLTDQLARSGGTDS